MIGHILHGWLFWKLIKIKFGINYHKVVLVLAEENAEVDRQALAHLRDFMERKYADSAIVFCRAQSKEKITVKEETGVLVEALTDDEIELLYSFYCFTKYFDNIAFTFTDTPKDNMLGRYLKETEINEEDAVCLALYHLRQIPKARG